MNKKPRSYTHRFLKEPLSFAEAWFYFCSMPFGLKVFLRFCWLVAGLYLFILNSFEGIEI